MICADAIKGFTWTTRVLYKQGSASGIAQPEIIIAIPINVVEAYLGKSEAGNTGRVENTVIHGPRLSHQDCG
jgi:hypothetical protein